MALPNDERVSEAQYLAAERASDVRHEYVNGEVIAMSGASVAHNPISRNIQRVLDRVFGDCGLFHNEVRVKTGLSYRYPDVVLLCGTPEVDSEFRDTLTNPEVLCEILSPSTERTDRSDKLHEYGRISTLKAYFLILQDKQRIEVYSLQPDDSGVTTNTSVALSLCWAKPCPSQTFTRA